MNKKALLAAARRAWSWPKERGADLIITPDGRSTDESWELKNFTLKECRAYG